MPSLRKRVSSYFRQLSFHNEPREKKHNINENSFITKYLQGHITLQEGPPIIYGKNPTDLPNYSLAHYNTGPNTVMGCYSGPNGGLTTVSRTEKHLSMLDADIDYIDIHDAETGGEHTETTNSVTNVDDSMLPENWNRKSNLIYGLSDSLYDRNQVTKNTNGDPIADCFGIIARNDSAILAVADGVNWGEKASIAAKSAVHGCLHYLNKTIFNDTKPFENLTIKTDESSISSNALDESANLINNTREVFVCLLRAFNCAHDLILENKGMLTTLTVAVILPLKQKLEKRTALSNGVEKRDSETQYICCVCNVGDTLAYVYSPNHGVRELTKGSHDIHCNRDMRDALGALGPVDGINPELSNLTLSITTLQKGDIVMVASDGLTDNFDPNVCKFTVNANVEPSKIRRPSTSKPYRSVQPQMHPEMKPSVLKPAGSVTPLPVPPLKPPRRSKNKEDFNRSSVDRGSIKSSTVSEKSSSSADNSSLHSKSNNPQNSNISNMSKLIGVNNSLKSEVDSNSNESGACKLNDELKCLDADYDNPLIAAFMKENSVDSPKNDKDSKKPTVVENKASSLRRQASSQLQQGVQFSQNLNVKPKPSLSRTLQSVDDKSSNYKRNETGYKFLRSKTTLDIKASTSKQITRNDDGIPYVTPIQRYELQLLMIEDILKNGISGKDSPCTSSKELCEKLVRYTISITSAKRHTLEDQDLYFDNNNGVLVEVPSHEKKIRRKKGLEKVKNLPGKLDHVTIVAYNVGNYAY